MLAGVPIVNEIAQARVKIDGYHSIGDDGIVECITTMGNRVSLIDKDQKLHRELVSYGGRNVRIQFRVGIEWRFFTRIQIFVIGINP